MQKKPKIHLSNPTEKLYYLWLASVFSVAMAIPYYMKSDVNLLMFPSC